MTYLELHLHWMNKGRAVLTLEQTYKKQELLFALFYLSTKTLAVALLDQ